MKNHLLLGWWGLVLATTLSFQPLHGQTGPVDSLKARFDLLEPYVYTGFLYDRIFLSDLRDSSYSAQYYKFTGAPNSGICKYNTYKKLVNDFRSAVYDTLDFPTWTDVRNRGYSAQSQFDLPLSVLQLDFQKLDTNAANQGWLLFDTASFKFTALPDTTYLLDTIFDSNGNMVGILDTAIYNNPDSLAALALPLHRLFAATTLPNYYGIPNLQNSFSIGLSDSLFFSNMPGLISLDINLNDGQGWQALIPNQPIVVQYGTFGLKLIRIRFNMADWVGEMPIAKTGLLLFQSAPAPDAGYNSSNLPKTNPCPQLTDGGFGTGEARVSIKYANPQVQKLTKPFILVEGFDSYLRKSSNDYNRYDPATQGYGRLTWNGFMTGFFFNDDGDSIYQQLKQAPLLMDSLMLKGYDIVLVDFKSGLQGIEKNANTLIDIIQWINQEKDGPEELVVIGGSMGGLITRYALRKMELEGCCHQVRLYGTFDTPHRGANIPLGVQEWVYNAAYNFQSKEAETQYKDVLKSRSASQMLIYHRDPNQQKLFEDMQFVLDSMGHPQDCYRMAISNGNGKGIGLNFGGGTELLKYELELDAPVTITAPSAVLPSIIINNKFTLLQNNCYAVANSPVNASGQIILKSKPLIATAFNYGILQGVAWVNKSALTTAKATKIAADVAFPMAIPANILAYQIANAAITASFAAILIGIKDNNNLYLNNNVYLGYPTLPVDYCPGSTTNTMQEVAGPQSIKLGQIFDHSIEIGVGEVEAKQSDHTFISSISSIDYNTNQLTTRLDTLTNYLNFKPKFNIQFYAENDPFKHEKHVEITPQNRHFLTSNIDACIPLQPASLALPATPYFNYGNANHYTLKSITVGQGTFLKVNAYLGTDFGQGPYPGYLTRFTLKTGHCGTYVGLMTGGTFELGDTNFTATPNGVANNTAEVRFLKGSILEIWPGGTLYINNNSLLIIEPGAQLIIHPGANIVLSGPNAVLELQGDVNLMQDATFTFQGSGFVRYAMDHTQGTSWNLAGNNRFQLRGTGKKDKVLEVVTATALNQFEEVAIARGNVAFAQPVAMHIGSPVTLDTALFAPIDTISASTAPGFFGVILEGSPSQLVRYSRFVNAEFGLANNGLQGFGVAIVNSAFARCSTGLRLEGPGGTISGSSFHQNTIGLDANNISLEVTATASTFADNSHLGIWYSGSDGNAKLTLEDCYLSNNGYSGMQSQNGTFISKCTDFVQNSQYGIIADRNRVVLRGTYMSNNQKAFSGSQIALLDINHGYNAFINSTSGQDFHAQLDATYSTLFTTTFKALKNSVSGTISIHKMTGPLTVVLSPPPTPSGLVTFPPFLCATNLPITRDLFGNLSTGFDNIGVGNNGCISCRFYVNSPVISALADIYNRLENRDPATLLEDIERADEIASIFEGKSLTIHEEMLRDYALFAAMEALSAAFSEGLLEAGGDAQYTDMVMNRLQAVTFDTTAAGSERLFSNRIGQALMLRLNHRYDDALNLLANHAAFATTPVQTNQALYWTCALEGERDLLNGSLSFDEFLLWNATCSQTFGMRGPQAAFEPSPVVIEQAPLAVGAQPNPATERTTVAFSHPVEGTLTLVDRMGKAVAGPFNLQGAEQLEVPLALPAGVYVVVVQTTTAERATCKLVIH